MGVKIDVVKARTRTMLALAQHEKDKRAKAKKETAGEADATHEDAVQPIRAVGGLIDRSA